MTYKLSDTERTLLSAYMDAELLPDEQKDAEQLLARSEDARVYLAELRALYKLSGGMLAASCGAEGSVAVLTNKLSGQAIQAAAGRAVVAKSVAVGSWGVAGIIGSVAVVVTGIAMFVGSPEPSQSGDVVARDVKSSISKAIQPSAVAQPALGIDSSNLLVPPMTPSDLLTFAMDGTLPIDAKRARYITMQSSGKDGLSVEMHAKAPKNMTQELPSLNGSALAILDSIQRVVRTSLLQCSPERIALRADIPALRLGVIRTFEKAAPHLPTQIQERLDRSRVALVAEQAASGHADVYSAAGAGVGNGGLGPVPYMIVAFDGVGDHSIRVPLDEYRGAFGDNISPVMIDQDDLFFLQQMMPQPPAAPVNPLFDDEPRDIIVNSNPSGVRIQPRSDRRRSSAVSVSGTTTATTTTTTAAAQQGFDGLLLEQGGDSGAFASIFDNSGVMRLNGHKDSVLQRLRLSLQRANENMRRADSLMKYVRQQLLRKAEQNQDGRQEISITPNHIEIRQGGKGEK